MKNVQTRLSEVKAVSSTMTLMLLTAACLTMMVGFRAEETGTLSIKVSNIKTTGKIKVAIYRAEDDFPKSKFMVSGEFGDCTNGACEIKFPSLPVGTYAIALYQDVNGNNKLDKGAFGIPSEPFAFSNNVRPKFGSPDFDDCKFDFSASSNSIAITMINSLFGGD